MPDYVEYFLKSQSSIVQYDTIEISHPDFSKTFYVVRNNTRGITATLETASTVYFSYYPMSISKQETNDDLDFGISVEFGDLGEVLPTELDLLETASSFTTKPVLKYRSYRSDDLSEPMFGPVTLELTNMIFAKSGVKFEANAPRFNLHKTGIPYRILEFPCMHGFLE